MYSERYGPTRSTGSRPTARAKASVGMESAIHAVYEQGRKGVNVVYNVVVDAIDGRMVSIASAIHRIETLWSRLNITASPLVPVYERGPDGQARVVKCSDFAMPAVCARSQPTRAPTVYGRQTVQIMPCRAFWPTTRTQD